MLRRGMADVIITLVVKTAELLVEVIDVKVFSDDVLLWWLMCVVYSPASLVVAVPSPVLPPLLVLLVPADSLKLVLLKEDETLPVELVRKSDEAEDSVDVVVESSKVELDLVYTDERKLLELEVHDIISLVVVVKELPKEAVKEVSADDILIPVVSKDDGVAVEVVLVSIATTDDGDVVDVTPLVDEKISDVSVATKVLLVEVDDSELLLLV